MKKKKILVIFFISIIVSYLIYNKFNDNINNILIISDNENIRNNIFNQFNKEYNINMYNYDDITYKQLIKNIKENDNKIIKENIIYLNQLISSSNIIFININNSEYFNKCKKSDNIIINYDKTLEDDINSLYEILSKISHAKIYIIGNYCKNKEHTQALKIPFEYLKYDYFNKKET